MKLTNIQEEYLKVIYLTEKNNEKVRVTDIATKLGKTKPTVNYAINALKEIGLIEYEAYGEVKLTKEGEDTAKKILEAYDIVYLFLNGLLELSKEKAEQEAQKMEAVLEDETINKLAVYTHKMLGLNSLECGYDINNKRCIGCVRRTVKGEKKDINE